jgi:hypothetical protein
MPRRMAPPIPPTAAPIPAPRPELPAMAPINAAPRGLEPLPRAARVLRHSMVEAHSLAGEGHNPEVGNIAHIDHRLTPALRHGSTLLHQARDRSEPFLDRLMAERHPGYMAAAREWQSAMPAGASARR